MVRLKDRYKKEIVPALMKEFGYNNIMQAPGLKKVVLNIGAGEATTNAKGLEAAQRDLSVIAGQHAVITKAKRSISAFKLREGQSIGTMVTLRGQRMYDFVERFINSVLPRIRDFQGVPGTSFDGRGNYHLGLKEQLVFPEIEYDKIDKVRGLQISFVISARNDKEGKRLLELMGMPFQKE
ncbi:MAG: 50S ribosomal protein L5 [Chloroflexi bacterium]|nr:50S ribosomal protein L5 [Chloroflexota bacterium]